MQAAVLLQLMLTYLTASLFVPRDHLIQSADEDSFGLLVLLLNTLCFVLMAGFVACGIYTAVRPAIPSMGSDGIWWDLVGSDSC